MELSVRLENLRESRGVSVREVAKRIGEPPATVARWFGGESEPRLSEAVKLAAFFAVPLGHLAGESPESATVRSQDEYTLLTLFRALGLDVDEAARRLAGAVAPLAVPIAPAPKPAPGPVEAHGVRVILPKPPASPKKRRRG